MGVEEESTTPASEQEAQSEPYTDDDFHYPAGWKEESKSETDEAKETEEETSDESKQQIESMTKGWAEDRDKLSAQEEELTKLRTKASKEEEYDDEDDDLSEKERVEKILERREKDKTDTSERQKEKEKSELRFMKTTNKFFVDNEKEILKLRDDEGLSLTKATSICKRQKESLEKAIKKATSDDERKKGKTTKKPKETQKQGKEEEAVERDIGDIYRNN